MRGVDGLLTFNKLLKSEVEVERLLDCLWDIRIVESGGAFMTFQSLKINPDFTSINYFYKNGIGTFHFGVG